SSTSWARAPSTCSPPSGPSTTRRRCCGGSGGWWRPTAPQHPRSRRWAHSCATEPALPAWCEAFVTQGYAHYCTLLPTSFMDDDAGVAQVAAMLGFLFSMESLALALGGDRAQLELAVRQSHPEAPAKVALLWAAHHQLGLLPMA